MKSVLKISLLIAFILFGVKLNAQTITITDPDQNPINCANYDDGAVVNFQDDGATGNYGSNRNDVITICPDLPSGPKLTLVFATNAGLTYDIHPSDTLYVFDGNSVSAPLLGTLNSGINPNGGSFVSSFENNPSGCLTIQFISDGANEGTGWGANLTCGNPAQPFEPHIEAYINGQGLNALNPLDTGYVDICLGDSILFVAKTVFPYSIENNPTIGGYSQTAENVTYMWETSNGWQGPDNDSIWFKPETRNGFYLDLVITDNFPQLEQTNCKIRVSQQPLFIGTGAVNNPICENEQAVILGGATSQDTVGVQFPPTAFDLGGTLAGLTYLPDGSGQEYSTTINMDDFDSLAVFSDASDLLNVCLTMEHSYLGDLEVWLTCPNGTQVALINSYSPGAIPDGFGGGGTFLGDADDTGNGTPGIGWEYCFSSLNNTFQSMGDELANGNTLPTTISNGDAMNPDGVYLPETSFADFIGCPLNGDWTINVRDNLGVDDGYIFEWGLYFNSDLFPDYETYNTNLIEDFWTADPTIISNQNDTSIVVFPGAVGNFDYTFNVTDNFGCHFDTTVTITVNALPLVDPIANQTVCDGEDFLDVVLTGSVNTTFEWTNSDPNIGLPASGTGDIPAFTATGTIPMGGSVTATITVTPIIQGGCDGLPVTFTLTVNSTEDASFDLNDSYCTTEGIQLPTNIILPGGTFESFSGVVVDPVTGQFDVSTLADGQYEVTYNTPGNSGFCATNSSQYFYVAEPSTLTVQTPISQSVCDNTSFATTSFVGGGEGTQFLWSNDNPLIGIPESGIGNISSFLATGTTDGGSAISATITVTPFAGACQGPVSETFTLTVNPKPVVEASADVSVCEGTSAQVSVVNPIGANYQWNNGLPDGPIHTVSPSDTTEYVVFRTLAGCTNSDTVIVNISPIPLVDAGTYSAVCSDDDNVPISGTPVGGTFSGTGIVGNEFDPSFDTQTLTYSYTDPNSGCSSSDQVTITVNPLPTVTITPVSPICEGETATITASGANTLSWDNGLGVGPSKDVTPTVSTLYSVTGISIEGCRSTESIQIVVNQLPIINAGSDVGICFGASTTITATGGTSYVWDNSLGSGASHSVSPAVNTIYNVVGTDANGCVNSDQVEVSINGAPVIDAGNDTTICVGNPVTLSGTGGQTYTWDNGVVDGVSFIPTGTTTYSITGTNSNGCTAFDEVVVTVLEQPVATISPSTISGTPTLNVDFVNLSTNSNSYTWNLGNGGSDYTLSLLSTESASYSSIGTYTVTLTASNGLCSNSTSVVINVINFDPAIIIVPNIFTPDGDKVNDGLYLSIQNGVDVEVQIYNRWGNFMYEIKGLWDKDNPATYWDGTKDGKEATEGVYFITYKVTGIDGNTTTGQENVQLVRK